MDSINHLRDGYESGYEGSNTPPPFQFEGIATRVHKKITAFKQVQENLFFTKEKMEKMKRCYESKIEELEASYQGTIDNLDIQVVDLSDEIDEKSQEIALLRAEVKALSKENERLLSRPQKTSVQVKVVEKFIEVSVAAEEGKGKYERQITLKNAAYAALMEQKENLESDIRALEEELSAGYEQKMADQKTIARLTEEKSELEDLVQVQQGQLEQAGVYGQLMISRMECLEDELKRLKMALGEK